MTTHLNPWLALVALVCGVFMILLDMTGVVCANPVICASYCKPSAPTSLC